MPLQTKAEIITIQMTGATDFPNGFLGIQVHLNSALNPKKVPSDEATDSVSDTREHQQNDNGLCRERDHVPPHPKLDLLLHPVDLGLREELVVRVPVTQKNLLTDRNRIKFALNLRQLSTRGR